MIVIESIHSSTFQNMKEMEFIDSGTFRTLM